MGTQCNYVKEHCEKANAEEKKPWQCTTTTKKNDKKTNVVKEHHDKLGL
jgi:ribosomal protein L7/L12